MVAGEGRTTRGRRARASPPRANERRRLPALDRPCVDILAAITKKRGVNRRSTWREAPWRHTSSFELAVAVVAGDRFLELAHPAPHRAAHLGQPLRAEH